MSFANGTSEGWEWGKKGDEDLNADKILIKAQNVSKSIIGFHIQQATEKYLKAYLIAKEQNIPKTHNLEFLKALCAKLFPDFDNFDFGNLTSYAVEFRYPGILTLTEPKKTLVKYMRTANKLRNLVVELL